MWFVNKFLKQFHTVGQKEFKIADAIVLSSLPGNKLLLQVMPVQARNFVSEVETHSALSSYIKAGQRIRIKYISDTRQTIEILSSVC